MIHRVEIDNFALVEHSGLSFSAGFTALSGETGAGKSIVVDALDFAAGGRSDRSMLRSGAEEATVSVLFEVKRQSGSDELVVTRGLRDNNRSYAKLNGRLVTVTELREITEPLIAIHSQNDQQSIFRESTHRLLLDAFGGECLLSTLAEYTSLFSEIKEVDQRLTELFLDPETRERRRSILAFQVDEIETSHILADEEQQLLKNIRTLSAVREIATFLGQAMDEFSGDDDYSIQSRMGRAISNLESAAKYSSRIQDILERLESIRADLSEVIFDIERVYDKLGHQPDELERLNERLILLRRLQEKYGDDLESVIAYGKKARAELARLEETEEELSRLTEKKHDLISSIHRVAERLYKLRAKAALSIADRINDELADLNMKNAFFSVSIDKHELNDSQIPVDPHSVSFMIAPNPGEPSMPLISIVSGGEASRVLLAIKTVLASLDNVSTLIFDEIDTGISGQTTTMIARKLKAISEHCQVICVTHSAQIAAMADQHLLIGKQVEDGRTRTSVHRINGDERVSEIARLLTGKPNDEASRVLAIQLIDADP